MCCSVGGGREANVRFSTNGNRKLSDIPAAMTLPVDRYVDVHVTGNELIGVDSDELLLVLRMRGTTKSDNDDDDDDEDDMMKRQGRYRNENGTKRNEEVKKTTEKNQGLKRTARQQKEREAQDTEEN